MKIKSVRIINFRAFADETILLDSYTSLVGPNGAGKSTLLCALNVFFREQSNATPVDYLVAEDFHKRNTRERVEITLTFGDLSDVAKQELSDYVRNDLLIVSAIAEFDDSTERAQVRQFGSRLGIAEFAPFFAAYKRNASAAELTTIFDDIRTRIQGIGDGRTKDAKRDALHAFEANPINTGLLGPLESEDQFYGIAGQSKLKSFIQWVYVPAVKDACDEQSENRDGALGKLLARTVRARVNFKEQISGIQQDAQTKYVELLDANQGALNDVATSLSRRLSEWSHPNVDLKLNWSSKPISIAEPSAKVVAVEQGFEGELSRFGHGFQRSYLLALLQELAAIGGDAGPTLFLGVEEPELYQHPPQARYLAQTLQALSSNGAQVAVTTHSPYFICGSNFENVRLFRKSADTATTTVYSLSYERYAERYAESRDELPRKPSATESQINEVLRANINELFFATKLVLVEGPEDLAYITTWMALTNRLQQFRSQGGHVVFVEGKQNLHAPLIIAQELKIPVFVVFDGDHSKSNDNRQAVHNRGLLRLLGAPDSELFPIETVWANSYVQWSENIATAVEANLAASLTEEVRTQISEGAQVDCGHAPSLDKNSMYIQYRLSRARNAGGNLGSLDRLCDAILQYA